MATAVRDHADAYNPPMSSRTFSGRLGADTDSESERHQIDCWRVMAPTEKFCSVAELNAAVDTMALAGIRLRHPDASPREQFLRLACLKLGRDLALQAYPEVAQLTAP